MTNASMLNASGSRSLAVSAEEAIEGGKAPGACVIDDCRLPPLGENIALCGHHAAQVIKSGIVTAMGLYMADTSGPIGAPTFRHDAPSDPDVLPSDFGVDGGYVYLIRFASRIKIGFSADWRTRIKDLPVDEVLLVLTGNRVLEGTLHRKFAEHRVTGEWFEDCPPIRRFIAAMLAEQAAA